MEEDKKNYILVEKTVKELEEIVNEHSNDYNFKIYEHQVKRDEEYSEEQKAIQYSNKWQANISSDIRMYDEKIYELVRDVAHKVILGGEKEDILNKIKDKVMSSKVRSVLYVQEPRADETFKRAYIETEYGDRKEGEEYYEDEEQVNEELKNTGNTSWNYSVRTADGNPTKDIVMIDEAYVSMYIYNYNGTEDNVVRLIKKFIRNELTYCIKQGNVIVPQEYLDKGIEGIEEWRNIKSSNNKNNNMEKRMLREMLRDKKQAILMQMRNLLWRFPTGQDARDWSIPYITIYGNGNRAMAQKLANQVLGKKTDQEILNLTEEDVDKAYKEYWKGVLNKAIEQIDDVITYGDR